MPTKMKIASCVEPDSAARRPVALALTDQHLLVANRNGILTILDPDSLAIIQQSELGESLSDLTVSRAGDLALATDQQAHQLVELEWDGQQWRERQRLTVPWSPVSVHLAADERFGSIASLWARQLTIVERAGAKLSWHVRHIVDLPFAPRCQWIHPASHHILVADSFGSQLALVDPEQGTIVARRTLPGSNIRALTATPDGESLFVSLQLINELVPTQRERVVWGAVVSNLVIRVPLDELLPTSADETEPLRPIAHWSVYPLGSSGQGSGDPTDLVCHEQGHWVVALGGVDQIVEFQGPRKERRTSVGRRPTCIVADARRQRWYVANTLDDSISVVDARQCRVETTIALSSPKSSSPEDAGERLFYDARLSLDGWYSCHSCHTDGHTTGLRTDNLADGDFGAPKRIPSLLGTGLTAPWAWNGKQETLDEQIHQSVHSTMQGGEQHPVGAQELAAVEAYLRSLPSPPGIDRARRRLDAAAVQRGQRAFELRGCTECHEPPTYSSPGTFDVGLADEHRRRQFNPPSLRGVSQRHRFLHDNRAASLRDVFTVHGHPAAATWEPSELDDLLAYLRSL